MTKWSFWLGRFYMVDGTKTHAILAILILCFRRRAMIILFSPELLRPRSEGNPDKLEHVRG